MHCLGHDRNAIRAAMVDICRVVRTPLPTPLLRDTRMPSNLGKAYSIDTFATQ